MLVLLFLVIREESQILVKHIEEHISRADGEDKIALADRRELKQLTRRSEYKRRDHLIVRAEHDLQIRQI